MLTSAVGASVRTIANILTDVPTRAIDIKRVEKR